MHEVISVDRDSLSSRNGIEPGDIIISINGEEVIDDIDFQALTAGRRVRIQLAKADGSKREVDIIKAKNAPLGMHLAQTLVCDPRSCANQCVFCFVDQMPTGMRKSLYVKDDDWRLSLMMGNFVTLTNVSNREFERILRRKASPLYVSVHATDPEVRVSMMRQKRAAELMPRLERLCAAGLQFHAQVVLCPGLNDGVALERTLDDLLNMSPCAKSCAVVPVGLTKYRMGLSELHPYNKESAAGVLDICRAYQRKALARCGSRFVFPADEFYCLAQTTLPGEEEYEGYPQLENGIGMMRNFDTELHDAISSRSESQTAPVDSSPAHVLIPCGTSIHPYMQEWARLARGSRVQTTVRVIKNLFFGETVTVSGLITGQDLVQQLLGVRADLLLVPKNMLNAEESRFLDDMSLKQVEDILGIPIRVIQVDGHAFYHSLQNPLGLLSEGVHHAEA